MCSYFESRHEIHPTRATKLLTISDIVLIRSRILLRGFKMFQFLELLAEVFIQMDSDLLLTTTLFSTFRAFGFAVTMHPFSMFRSVIVRGETFVAIWTLIRLLAGVFPSMMIPRILSSETHVAEFADKRLLAGVQKDVIVQGLSIVESFRTLSALIPLFAVVFAFNMIDQKLLNSEGSLAYVALEDGIYSSLVNFFFVRF